MFHNSFIFNVPFVDNCSVKICYFSISRFNSIDINSFFSVFIILRLSQLIQRAYKSPNSIEFE